MSTLFFYKMSSSNDVVILSACRTPITKAKKGGLSGATPDVLLRTALQAAVAKSSLPVEALGDVVVGNVLQPGGGAVMGRIAQLCAGIPASVPLASINRQCSSGLQALATIFGSIRAGVIEAGIGAGTYN